MVMRERAGSSRRADGEGLDVEALAGEQAGDLREDAGLLVHKDGEGVQAGGIRHDGSSFLSVQEEFGDVVAAVDHGVNHLVGVDRALDHKAAALFVLAQRLGDGVLELLRVAGAACAETKDCVYFTKSGPRLRAVSGEALVAVDFCHWRTMPRLPLLKMKVMTGSL